MPLIVMLILTIIIPTIIYVAKNVIQPTETAEIEKQEESDEEKISAASVRVEAGDSYTVPKDGIYKIELHGGKSEDIELTDGTIIPGNKGSKVTGYVRLNEGENLRATVMNGGKEPSDMLSPTRDCPPLRRCRWFGGKSGMGLCGVCESVVREYRLGVSRMVMDCTTTVGTVLTDISTV